MEFTIFVLSKLTGLVVILHTEYLLQIFQQNRYELRRLKNWLFLVLKKQPKLVFIYLSIILGEGLLYFINQDLFLYGTIIINLFIILIIIRFYYKQKAIIALNITARVKRQIAVYGLLIVLSVYLSYRFNFWVYLTTIFSLILPWIFLFLVGIITMPFEKLAHLSYMRKAKAILKKHQSLIKIGITGSYGKTSTKNILQEILSAKYYSLMTPASYNTPMGITITIRNHLKNIHQVFICEMGADKVGEIKELANFVKPQYGIVTSIGYQHLATFKNINNIINEKMALIELLPKSGVAVLNRDEMFIRDYQIKNNCQIIWYSLVESDSDYQAVNIKYSLEGTSFLVKTKTQEAYQFKTTLLGKHNVANILAGIALGRELGISWDTLQETVALIKQVKNRLELKKIFGLTFIDNSFNSNPVSVIESLEVLSKMAGRRYIITPGLIDLGPIEDQENKKFGLAMLGKVDTVILVGKKQTQAIYQGLKASGFDLNQVVIVDTTVAAFDYVRKEASKEDIILIENDLPDAFNW